MPVEMQCSLLEQNIFLTLQILGAYDTKKDNISLNERKQGTCTVNSMTNTVQIRKGSGLGLTLKVQWPTLNPKQEALRKGMLSFLLAHIPMLIGRDVVALMGENKSGQRWRGRQWVDRCKMSAVRIRASWHWNCISHFFQSNFLQPNMAKSLSKSFTETLGNFGDVLY